MPLKRVHLYNGVGIPDQPSPDNVRKLDLGIIPCITRMQSNGMAIDPDHFRKMSLFLRDECERITAEVETMTGYRLNLGSPDQIAILLFSQLGLKPPSHIKLTKSGKRLTVDEEALTSIKSMHPVIEKLLQYTELHKLRTSYTDVLPVIMKPNGRVYTSLRVTRQVSGRISSSKPNLMAIPTRSELGKKIRYGFIPRPGWLIGTMDQSQIEMRVAAHIASCIPMQDTFLRNGDIHIETATRIFFPDKMELVKRAKNKKEAMAVTGMDDMRHRYPAKRIRFGVLFGITGQGLQDQIFVADDPTWTDEDRNAFRAEWPVERCDQTIEMWFRGYPEIRKSINEEHAKARRFGMVWDLFGRIRLVPEVRSVHKRIVEAGLRQAYSQRISATATGTMKLTLAEMFDMLILKKYKGVAEPLLSVHDEVLFEARADVIGEFMEDIRNIAKNVMRNSDFSVPIEVGTDYGPSWGELSK